MASFHILFGFTQEDIETAIVRVIRKGNHTVTYVERDTKESIKAYLEEHPECKYAVLREGMGAESFSAEDFAELTDTRDINIVTIIEERHKGSEYMQILYAAGITSAIFVTEKKGASPSMIATLLMNKRTRKSARTYYGMADRKVALDLLSYDTFVYYYTRLQNDDLGINIVDRYISVVKELSAKQAAAFTRKLPNPVKKELRQYQEFHEVLDIIRKSGVDIKISRPQSLRRGLTDEEFAVAIKRDTALAKKALPSVTNEQSTAAEEKPSAEVEKIVEPAKEEAKGKVATVENIVIDNYFFQEAEDSCKETARVRVEGSADTDSVDPQIVASKKSTASKKTASKIQWKYVALTGCCGVFLLVVWYFITCIILS